MPSGPRIRANNSYGLTTDAPLTIGATTFNSAGLVTLPTVAAAHAIVTLDPLREFGEPEIVVVTAHTAAATVATITRGQYGTVARSHPVNTTWVHASLDEDFVEILTSGTLPANPYAGQEIFETDLDKYVARNAANTAWVDKVPLGAWQSFTSTFVNVTVGNGVQTSRFTRMGRLIHYEILFLFGTTSAMGTSPTFSLPATAATRYTGQPQDYGRAVFLDAGTAVFFGATLVSSTTVGFMTSQNSTGTSLTSVSVTATVPMTWATGDSFFITGTYEPAA